jgi:hypothetical protein
MVEVNSSEITPEILQRNVIVQSSFFDEWHDLDCHLKNTYLIIQSFAKNENLTACWETKKFQEEGDYDFYHFIRGPWTPLKPNRTDEGLEIKQNLIKSSIKVSLRSLAIDIKVQVRLTFHSSFFMMLRVVDDIIEYTPVIKVFKDENLRGLFVVFGNINPVTHKFKFIKQNQVPELNRDGENFRDLEIKVTDNGDDKVFVNISSYDRLRKIKNTLMRCSGFLPEMRDSQVYFAGHGDSVVLKNVSIQYRERIESTQKIKKPPDCVCSIF